MSSKAPPLSQMTKQFSVNINCSPPGPDPLTSFALILEPGAGDFSCTTVTKDKKLRELHLSVHGENERKILLNALMLIVEQIQIS